MGLTQKIFNEVLIFVTNLMFDSDGLSVEITDAIILITGYAYRLNWIIPIDTALQVLVLAISFDLSIFTIKFFKYVANVARGSGG